MLTKGVFIKKSNEVVLNGISLLVLHVYTKILENVHLKIHKTYTTEFTGKPIFIEGLKIVRFFSFTSQRSQGEEVVSSCTYFLKFLRLRISKR